MAYEANFTSVEAYVDPHVALTEAIQVAVQRHAVVIVTGSFYLVSMVCERLVAQ